jgi:hypothetical protein
MQNRNAFDKSAGNDELKMLKMNQGQNQRLLGIHPTLPEYSLEAHYFQAEITWSLTYFQMHLAL